MLGTTGGEAANRLPSHGESFWSFSGVRGDPVSGRLDYWSDMPWQTEAEAKANDAVER